jgi:hypothetical protein
MWKKLNDVWPLVLMAPAAGSFAGEFAGGPMPGAQWWIAMTLGALLFPVLGLSMKARERRKTIPVRLD